MKIQKTYQGSGDAVSFIKQVAQATSHLILEICQGFNVEGGYLEGVEFRWGNGSGRFVNVKTGLGQGFGTSAPSGGVCDSVSLVAAAESCTQFEAAKLLNDRYSLGIPVPGASLAYGPKAPARAVEQSPKFSAKRPLLPNLVFFANWQFHTRKFRLL